MSLFRNKKYVVIGYMYPETCMQLCEPSTEMRVVMKRIYTKILTVAGESATCTPLLRPATGIQLPVLLPTP